MPHAVVRRRHAVARGGWRRRDVPIARIALPAALLWLAAAAPLAGQGSHAQVYLTVLDRDGAPILDLQPSDVIVAENGVPGEVTHLVRPRARTSRSAWRAVLTALSAPAFSTDFMIDNAMPGWLTELSGENVIQEVHLK